VTSVRHLYRTQAWRRLRKQVLIRDGFVCQVNGPNCEHVATTAHHKLPASQHPELFFSPENVQAACARCNDHGGAVKGENRANRQTISVLEARIEELELELMAMAGRLAEYEPLKPKRKLGPPAIR
jgi:5-methylcytosine-specific restriction endonuclease McrA